MVSLDLTGFAARHVRLHYMLGEPQILNLDGHTVEAAVAASKGQPLVVHVRGADVEALWGEGGTVSRRCWQGRRSQVRSLGHLEKYSFRMAATPTA